MLSDEASEWLTVQQVMARYSVSRATVYKLAALLGSSRAPFVGRRLHGPTIDAHIAKHATVGLAQDVQGDSSSEKTESEE